MLMNASCYVKNEMVSIALAACMNIIFGFGFLIHKKLKISPSDKQT